MLRVSEVGKKNSTSVFTQRNQGKLLTEMVHLTGAQTHSTQELPWERMRVLSPFIRIQTQDYCWNNVCNRFNGSRGLGRETPLSFYVISLSPCTSG
jgi:hypothetical protein